MGKSFTYDEVVNREKVKYLDLTEGDMVLDINGGAGDLWRPIVHPSTYYLHNVEADDELRKRGEDIYSVSFSNIYDVPRKSIRQYDVVTLLGVLDRLDDPLRMMQNFGTAKRLYITVPNAESYHRYLARELGLISSLTDTDDAERVYTPASLRLLCQNFNQMFGYKYRIKLWTASFKTATSDDMAKYVGSFEQMNAAAEAAGIIGAGTHGADIVVDLERVSTW